MADPREAFEREILRERTRAAAETGRAQHRVPARTIDFTVAGERHAMDLDVLLTIFPVGELTPVPRAPPDVVGLMLYEGRIVPVFELAVVLDLPARSVPERSFVLLLGRDRAEVGLRVDDVGAVMEVEDPGSFAPTTEAPIRSEWIRGLGPEGVPVLDGARLLASDRLYVDIALGASSEPRGPQDAR